MKINNFFSFPAMVAMAVLSIGGGASAAVIRLDESNFLASAGLITFSEYAYNTQNPTYAPATYGGDSGSPTVTTGGYFAGQSLSAQPWVDCPNAAATACVVGTPTNMLTLDSSAPAVFITDDSANPTSPVLSGYPLFNGPIALLFSMDQVAVGFTAGYFDGIGSTAITAFARDGSLIGKVINTVYGIEFLGLATDDKTAKIAGVMLELVGNEPAGFGIDNVRFGVGEDIQVGDVPLPAGGVLLLSGLAAFAARRRKAA